MLPPAIWVPHLHVNRPLDKHCPCLPDRKLGEGKVSKKNPKSVSFQRVITCSQTLYFLFYRVRQECSLKSKNRGDFFYRKRKEWSPGKEKNVFLARSLGSRTVRTG